ncbi:hypothetical protein HQO82_13620 [Rhodococcus fascians]|nr:hypothetical protein [Rhodococcus fascians]MBY4114863.1 hypothetical protein [Rhodococcus fascians]
MSRGVLAVQGGGGAVHRLADNRDKARRSAATPAAATPTNTSTQFEPVSYVIGQRTFA